MVFKHKILSDIPLPTLLHVHKVDHFVGCVTFDIVTCNLKADVLSEVSHSTLLHVT